jgi:hypothetical protein
MTTTQILYTHLSFWRNGELVQMVAIDLGTRRPLAAQRTLRVWFARMASWELDDNYTVRIGVGVA